MNGMNRWREILYNCQHYVLVSQEQSAQICGLLISYGTGYLRLIFQHHKDRSSWSKKHWKYKEHRFTPLSFLEFWKWGIGSGENSFLFQSDNAFICPLGSETTKGSPAIATVGWSETGKAVDFLWHEFQNTSYHITWDYATATKPTPLYQNTINGFHSILGSSLEKKKNRYKSSGGPVPEGLTGIVRHLVPMRISAMER